VIGAILVLLPWGWFLVRDAWAPLNAASVAMPALGGAGGVALLLGAGVARRLVPVLAAVSLLAMTALTVIAPLSPQPAGRIATPLTIASANIYDSTHTPRAAAEALVATDADVLVAVEAPAGFSRLFKDAVGKDHTYEAEGSGIEIRSRFPIEPLPVPSRLSSTRVFIVSVRPPGGPAFTLLAIHAINPIQESSFVFQQKFVERLDQTALERQGAAGPVVIAGDLNLSDRTHGYRILSSDFRDAMRAGAWAGDTYIQGIWKYALLRIDHLFVSRTWCASDPSRFTIPGSDHEGIRATVGPCG
jgi:endonuclease/exonuclease/phosphatase (EEP) superfamily protein YafD